MTFGASPMPNHRISQGVSAYFGMPCDARMNGSTAAVTRGDSRSRNGSADARDAADHKAGRRDAHGRDDVGESLPLPAISTMRCAVASGGAKNSGPNGRAAHSQASSSATAEQMRPPVTIHWRGMARLSGSRR